jgi:hypothetical protein
MLLWRCAMAQEDALEDEEEELEPGKPSIIIVSDFV